MKKVNVHPNPPNQDLRTDLAVAVLAGGVSRRYGSDKALIQLCPGGKTLIELVVGIAGAVTRDVFIVGHARYAPFSCGVPIVPDDSPGSGPLAAIRTALRSANGAPVLVVACDQPCLSVSLLRTMTSTDFSADVLAPRTADGRLHPMPAIYRPSALPSIDMCLLRGERSIATFLNTANRHEIQERALRQYDPGLDSLFSLNSPEQLVRAQQCVQCKQLDTERRNNSSNRVELASGGSTSSTGKQ